MSIFVVNWVAGILPSKPSANKWNQVNLSSWKGPTSQATLLAPECQAVCLEPNGPTMKAGVSESSVIKSHALISSHFPPKIGAPAWGIARDDFFI